MSDPARPKDAPTLEPDVIMHLATALAALQHAQACTKNSLTRKMIAGFILSTGRLIQRCAVQGWEGQEQERTEAMVEQRPAAAYGGEGPFRGGAELA